MPLRKVSSFLYCPNRSTASLCGLDGQHAQQNSDYSGITYECHLDHEANEVNERPSSLFYCPVRHIRFPEEVDPNHYGRPPGTRQRGRPRNHRGEPKRLAQRLIKSS